MARQDMVIRVGVLLLMLVPTRARADEQMTDLQPGARVRVVQVTRDAAGLEVDRKSLKGQLIALGTDMLRLDTGSRSVNVSLRDIALLQVAHGQKRATARGAGIGFLVGFVGFAAWAIKETSCDRCEVSAGFGTYAAAAGLSGVAAAAVGAVIGSQVRVDRWQDHPLPGHGAGVEFPVARVRVQVSSQRRGGSVAVVLAF